MTTEAIEQQRREIYEMAEAIAPGWERWRARIEEVTTPVREWMLAELAPRSGDTVLELAAGAGDTGFEAAAMAGEGGRLISTDFSPAMVEVARRRGAELALGNVHYRVMDAERIELDADSVDGVLCRFGYMLMPDPVAAVAETRRVLRPGGRLALAVWSAPERNPWVAIGGRVLTGLGLVPRPQPGEPGMFVLADESRLRGLLEGAGFTVQRVEDVPVLFTYDDVDHYIAAARETGGMFARVWNATSDEEHEAIKAGLVEGFVPFAVDGGYELPGVAVGASAH